MQTTNGDPNGLHVVNYVPDEMCVVVSAPGVDDESAFYEHVRSRLNRQIAAILKAGRRADDDDEREDRDSDDQADPFEADLAPVLLAQRFANDRAVLQPLRRSAPRRGTSSSSGVGRSAVAAQAVGGHDFTPWSVFRPNAATTHHLYFRLGRHAQRSANQPDLERQRIGVESVRELTLLLNRVALSTRQEPFGTRDWSIKAASPNWLTVAFQNPCGCAAGLPLPVPSKTHRWRFGFRRELGKALEAPVVQDVLVAVLDTCPQQASLDQAAGRFSSNGLLASVDRDVRMNTPAIDLAVAGGTHLSDYLPRLQWDMQSGPVHDHPERFTLADHGLFVAGIVYDVLQGGGQVRLMRVLNDYGIGDLFAITRALAELPGLLLGGDSPRPGEPRLVVNLSLGIDLPIPQRLLERWLPLTAQDPDALRRHLPDVSTILAQVHANLADAIAALTERGVLVVAATGNDALRRDVAGGAPPPPRFPARYDDVLGVAATRRDLRSPGNYSNRGELAAAAWPGDVSTFGGNIVRAGRDDEPSTTDPEDGVVGIFSSPTLPGGAANTSGWVRWAGTSFSTPIVAAVAARLWAANPNLKPQDLIAWLVGTFAHHPHAGGNPDSPLGVPVLDVSQA